MITLIGESVKHPPIFPFFGADRFGSGCYWLHIRIPKLLIGPSAHEVIRQRAVRAEVRDSDALRRE